LTWTSTYRLRQTVRNSLAIVPIIYLIAALVAGTVIPNIDRDTHTPELLGANPDSVRDVLSSIATGMLAFTGFVVTVVLLLVQFGTATFGPRLVRWARQARLLKHALGMFTATFIFAIVALDDVQRDDETFVPDLTLAIAIVLLVASLVLFFLLLDGISNTMRPAAVGQSIAKRARVVLRQVYPDLDDGRDVPIWTPHRPPVAEVTMRRSRGATLITVDRAEVQRYVGEHDVVLELVPAIGEHVRFGDTLFRVYGDAAPNLARLESTVVLGDERNLEDDPAFAFRLLVDIAIKALSPAINDPSTAVQMLDWIDDLLREASARDLGGGLYRDADGTTRIVYRTSTWADLVALAFEEIAWYGRESIQVTRRLQAILDGLITDLPRHRRPPLEELRARITTSIEESFVLRGTRATASQPDRLGLGMAERPLVLREVGEPTIGSAPPAH
jgi:uncharacterized membrane protein